MKTQDKTEEIEFHDALAEKMSYEIIEDKNLKERFDKIMKHIQIIPGKALDAGCGTGEFTVRLAKSGLDVVGLDISKKSIEFVNRYAKRNNLRINGVVGDLEKLPFQSSSFDYCFCFGTLHHFLDFRNALEELHRVLKIGGKIVVVEPNGSNPVLRASRAVNKNFLHIDSTSNETLHPTEDYIGGFARSGFNNIIIKHFSFDTMTKMRWKNIVLRLLALCKFGAQKLSRLLPEEFGSEYVMLAAEK